MIVTITYSEAYSVYSNCSLYYIIFNSVPKFRLMFYKCKCNKEQSACFPKLYIESHEHT